MEKTRETIQRTLDLIGFESIRIETIETENKLSVVIRDSSVSQARMPSLVEALTHLFRQMVKEENVLVVVDVNNYRRDREALITKLARAAAKKAAVTGEAVPLPFMNAYERRIVYTELAVRPDVETESEGEAKERRVVVRPTNL